MSVLNYKSYAGLSSAKGIVTLLLHRLQGWQDKCKNDENWGENTIKIKNHPSKLVKPIISLARPENDELDALEYTPRDTTSGN